MIQEKTKYDYSQDFRLLPSSEDLANYLPIEIGARSPSELTAETMSVPLDAITDGNRKTFESIHSVTDPNASEFEVVSLTTAVADIRHLVMLTSQQALDAGQGKTIGFQEKVSSGFQTISSDWFKGAINGVKVRGQSGVNEMLGLTSDAYYQTWQDSKVRSGEKQYTKGWKEVSTKKITSMTDTEMLKFLRNIVMTLSANNSNVKQYDVLLPTDSYNEILSKINTSGTGLIEYIATRVPEIRSFKPLALLNDTMLFYQNDVSRIKARILIPFSPQTTPKETMSGVIGQVYRMRVAGVHANGCSSFAKVTGIV